MANLTEFERNWAQIYESVYKDLFEASSDIEKSQIMAGKNNPDEPNELADLFAFRVSEKAEVVYNKQYNAPVNK